MPIEYSQSGNAPVLSKGDLLCRTIFAYLLAVIVVSIPFSCIIPLRFFFKVNPLIFFIPWLAAYIYCLVYVKKWIIKKFKTPSSASDWQALRRQQLLGRKVLAYLLASIPAGIAMALLRGMIVNFFGHTHGLIEIGVPLLIAYFLVLVPVESWISRRLLDETAPPASTSESPEKPRVQDNIKEKTSLVEDPPESAINIGSPQLPREQAAPTAAAGVSAEITSASKKIKEKDPWFEERFESARTTASSKPGFFQGLSLKHYLALGVILIFIVICGYMSSFSRAMHQRTVSQLNSETPAAPAPSPPSRTSQRRVAAAPAGERNFEEDKDRKKSNSTSGRASARESLTPRDMSLGQSQQFSPANNPLAQGLDFSVSYPQGWKKVPADGPRALAKFLSDQGQGHETLLLTVVPELPGAPQTITEEMRKETFKALVQKYTGRVSAVSSRSVEIAGQESLAVTYDSFEKKDGLTVYKKNTDYFLPVGRKTILIQCRVDSLQKMELEDKFKRFTPLFDNIARSLTLK